MTATHRLYLDVLGPTEVRGGEAAISLRPRERDVLAALAVRHPQPVPVADLAELLWVAPPVSDAKTLQNHVARIRRALGATAVRTSGSAYVLGDEWALDCHQFRRAVQAAQRASSVGDHRGARAQLTAALQLVRGEPFADLEATAALRAARDLWRSSIDDAHDGLLRALLHLGDTAGALAAAQSLWIGVREERAMLVAQASYRAGRRLDALRAVHACRQALRDRGLSPGDGLLRMELSLLADDPHLLVDDASSPVAPAGATGTASVLVGRDDALDRITAVLAAQFDGPAGCPPVVITGVAGIGKSALAGRIALEARLAGWTVVECSPPMTVAAVRQRTEEAEERPLLLLADDVDHLAAGDWAALAEGSPRTVLLATCAANPPAPTATVVPLQPLDPVAVQQLVEVTIGVTGDALPPSFIDAVARGSGGVPALVVELAIDGAQAPEGARLAQRLVDGLSGTARLLAAMVAVATAPVSAAALLGAAVRVGVGGSQREVAEGVARRVLLEDGRRLICRDDEVRAVLLEGVDRDWVRAVRHAWIAQHDADGDGVYAVAEHLVELPDWPAADAIERFDAARDLANAEVEFEAVIVNARRALALVAAANGPDHPAVLRREIDITWFSRISLQVTQSDEQWRLVERLTALEDHDNLVRLVGLMSAMVPILEAGRLDPRLVELIDHALDLPADPAIRSKAASDAVDLFALADIERCRRCAELSYADALAVGDEFLIMNAIEGLSMALGHPTDWPRRTQLGVEAIVLSERLDDGYKRGGATQMMFSCQLQQADPLVRATIDRMAALADRYDQPGYRFALGWIGAALQHVDGRLVECEATMQATMTLIPMAQSRLDALWYAQLLPVRVAQRRLGELRDPIARLAREQPQFGLWSGYRCWIEAALGNLDGAARLLDDIGGGAGLPHTISWAAATYSAARAAALIGDRDRCNAAYGLLAPHAGLMAWMGTGVVGPIDLALAELRLAMGDAAAAADHLAGADRLVRQLHAPVFEPELADLRERLERASRLNAPHA